MGIEIERKFIVVSDSWRNQGTARRCRQGYLSRTPECTVRVRVMDGRGYLTIKGKAQGISRTEYEYEIPLEEAEAMLDTLAAGAQIDKCRTTVSYAGHLWEIDEFFGENTGLVVAEIELSRADEPFAKPDWIGREVSNDPRYTNAALASHPYRHWKDEQ